MKGLQVWSLLGETKIPHAVGRKNQKVKQKQYCNKFNKDFKHTHPHQKKEKEQAKLKGEGNETLMGLRKPWTELAETLLLHLVV